MSDSAMSEGKYVPPHLRKKPKQTGSLDETGVEQSARRPSSLSVPSSSSLQRDVSRHRRFQVRDMGGNDGTLSSRWTDSNNDFHRRSSDPLLNRNSTIAPAATSGRFQARTNRSSSLTCSLSNSNNHNRSGNTTNVASSHSPLKRNISNRTTKIQFFGDSFIRIFTLMSSPLIDVQGFKGGSAKGIGRESNENRSTIKDMVKVKRPERLVFCFGSVDVHLSYFYNRVNDKDVDFHEIATKYLDFVNDELTDIVPPHMVTIVGVYPSPLNDDDVRKAVCNYGSVKEEQAHLLDEVADISNDARQARVRLFNAHLQEGCAKYGFHFDDVYSEMMDPTTNQMKDSFRDISSHNIHVVWETTVLLWMQKWPWFRELAPQGFEESLQKTLDKYLQTKPWAERTHIASTIGVRGAVDQDRH